MEMGEEKPNLFHVGQRTVSSVYDKKVSEKIRIM